MRVQIFCFFVLQKRTFSAADSCDEKKPDTQVWFRMVSLGWTAVTRRLRARVCGIVYLAEICRTLAVSMPNGSNTQGIEQHRINGTPPARPFRVCSRIIGYYSIHEPLHIVWGLRGFSVRPCVCLSVCLSVCQRMTNGARDICTLCSCETGPILSTELSIAVVRLFAQK